MKNQLNITSVKLTDGGLSGLEATYTKTENKNGRDFIAKHKDDKPYPIHTELEETFKWLKGHLLDLCNYSQDKEERAALLELTEVTEIKHTEKGFVIYGTMKGETKHFPLQTPLMTEDDGYAEFFDVTKILNALCTEVEAYLLGSKGMSDKAYVMKVNKDNAEFDATTFDKLPPEEQFKIANEYMAKNKFMVIPLDIVVEEETEKAPTSENWVGAEKLQQSIDKIASEVEPASERFGDQSKTSLDYAYPKADPVETITSKVKMTETDGDVIIDFPEPVAVKQSKKAK